MAAKHEYKQRGDNPAILSAMKESSCEMSLQQDSSGSPSFQECRPGLTCPVTPNTNTTGSPINNRLPSHMPALFIIVYQLGPIFVFHQAEVMDSTWYIFIPWFIKHHCHLMIWVLFVRWWVRTWQCLPSSALMLFSISSLHVTQPGQRGGGVEVWWGRCCLHPSPQHKLSFHCLVYMRPWSSSLCHRPKSQSRTLHLTIHFSARQQMEKAGRGGGERRGLLSNLLQH